MDICLYLNTNVTDLHFFLSNVTSFYTIHRKIIYKNKNVSNKFSFFLSNKKVGIFLYR
jgi:hypothetical protein